MTRPRPPKGAIIGLFIMLGCAVALGVAADRAWLMRSGRLMPMGVPAPPPFGRPSAEREAQMRAMLKRELGVTEAQEPIIDRIISEQMNAMDSLATALRPRVDTLFDRTRASLDSVLTPDQRVRRDVLLRKLTPFIDSIGTRRALPR